MKFAERAEHTTRLDLEMDRGSDPRAFDFETSDKHLCCGLPMRVDRRGPTRCLNATVSCAKGCGRWFDASLPDPRKGKR